jgi:hypothetical protein
MSNKVVLIIAIVLTAVLLSVAGYLFVFPQSFGLKPRENVLEPQSLSQAPVFSAPPAAESVPAEEEDLGPGNTVGNITNLGHLVKSGDWLFYPVANDNNSMYRMHLDGTELEKLNDDSSQNFNAVGDWIYYRNLSDAGYIYKMRTNGEEIERLDSGDGDDLSVIDGWIYYINKKDNETIYKIRTNGTERTKLNNDKSNELNVVDGWIYYSNKNAEDYHDYTLCKIRVDGSEKTVICDDTCYGINVVDGWVYYCNVNDNQAMYKIRIDGSERQMITDDSVNEYLNVDGEWIYYVNKSDNNFLYKIKINGSEKQMVIDEPCVCIYIIDDWIYYIHEEGWPINRNLYRVLPDGTENTEILETAITLQKERK